MLLILSIVGFVLGGAAQAPAAVDAVSLMNDVEALSAPSMQGRRTGTPGNLRARAYVASRFRELGLQPLGRSFEQRFTAGGRAAANIVGVVRGTARPDEFLLLTAHYDHLGVRNGVVYRGADDNASGVAAMLQGAAYVARHPLRHSVVFIAFDGEEQGLRGAKHFVARPLVDLERIRLMLNLDMVSRSDTATIFASGTAFHPELIEVVTRAAEGRRLNVRFGHDRPSKGAGGAEDWTQQSDQGPFHTAGVRTLYYGVEDHADYHKPTDTADRIPRPFFTEVAELVIRTLLVADGSA
ncbi:MAG TPA: M20/M25/M40 family metallo-hydrolase [Vicinamibacterales bacterium]|nr:M20/M25/M40 family metallo-hydrolase [Vicinamibacterales bacterium]